MNRFAALLDSLLLTPSRNGKLRLMREYFATTPDPERGWALAALTGGLVFDAAKPSQVRALAAARVDPELLGWSYDFVGDKRCSFLAAQHADREGPSNLQIFGVIDVYLIQAAETVSGVILSRHDPLPVLLRVRCLRR